MAPKAPKPPKPDILSAIDTFYWRGEVLVNRGDTVEYEHPMVKGREHLFRPFTPTFSLSSVQPVVEPEAEPEPDVDPEPEPVVEPEAE